MRKSRLSLLWEKLFPQGTPWWEVVNKVFIALIIPGIALLTYISTQDPSITVDNYLALKIEVTINGAYRGQVPAEGSRKFELYNNEPVDIEWNIIRQNNTKGHPVGDMMGGSFQAVDINKRLPITNVNTNKEFFFFPVLSNKMNFACEIYVNYGKPSQKYVGFLNPQTKNVYTGYYKWIEASNVALVCKNGKLYFWGDVKGDRVADLNVQAKSGISILTLFKE